MIDLFKNLFCLHKWKSHAKSPLHYVHKDQWGKTIEDYHFTDEVLICELCGKIKKIRY